MTLTIDGWPVEPEPCICPECACLTETPFGVCRYCSRWHVVEVMEEAA